MALGDSMNARGGGNFTDPHTPPLLWSMSWFSRGPDADKYDMLHRPFCFCRKLEDWDESKQAELVLIRPVSSRANMAYSQRKRFWTWIRERKGTS